MNIKHDQNRIWIQVYSSKKILLTCSFLFFFIFSHAQSYNWVKGGGSATAALYSRDDERVTSMCTDDNGNVYIVAPIGDFSIHLDTFSMTNAFNCCSGVPHTMIASYDCMGNLRWAKLIDAGQGTVSTGIAYGNGNIYSTGSLWGINKHIGYDTVFDASNFVSYLLKLDTLGHYKWIRFTGNDSINTWVNTGGYTNGMNNNVAVDGSGNVHHYDYTGDGVRLNSSVVSAKGTYDMKYDPSGNLLSVIQMEMDTNTVMTYPIIDKHSGTLYATIYVTDPSWGAQVNCLAAYDLSGHIKWYDTCWWPNSFVGLAFDGNDNIYTGVEASFDTNLLPPHFQLHGDTIYGNVYPYEILNLILTLDTFGNLKHHYDFHAKEDGTFFDLKLVPGGKIAITGNMVYAYKYGTDSIVNTTVNQEPFKVILDTLGNLQHWDYDTGTGFYNWGTALAVDNIGNIYIGGMNEAQLTIPTLSPILSVGGNSDFFVAKYGYICGCTVAPLASFNYTGTTTVSFTYTGSTGFDSLRWDFGDGNTSTTTNPIHTYAATGVHHVCLTVYTSCGVVRSCEDIGATTGIGYATMPAVLIYPNPATDGFFIENALPECSVKLFDMLGRQVYSGIITGSKQLISLNSFVSGVYMLQLIDISGNRLNKTVIKQ